MFNRMNKNVRWNEQKCSMGWMCLLRQAQCQVLSRRGAVSDFIEAFGVFSPVVENGIPVFEQFPRAA